MKKDEDSYNSDSNNFDSDSSDLCYRVARAPADSGCMGLGPGLYPMSGRSLDHNPGRTISQAGAQA